MNKFFVLFFCCLIVHSGHTQTTYKPAATKSPEASSIDKFIETPVSYFSGTANISIPLYEIKIKGVTIPVTLDYHSGGIRVTEESTWVGLGWSLNYGGQISRQVKGKPDEYSFLPGSVVSNDLTIAAYMALPNVHQDVWTADRCYFINRAKNDPNAPEDLMPDEFYYSAANYSGKFMFAQHSGKFVFFPKDDITVNYNLSSNMPYNHHSIDSWNMKLPDGTSLTFGEGAICTSGSWQTNPVTDAWLIKKISNNCNENIQYEYYSSEYHPYYKPSGETYSFYDRASRSVLSPTDCYESLVSDIKFPNGSLHFITSSRQDNPGMALSEIDILNENNLVIKRIFFYYSYFEGSFATYGNTGNNPDYDNKRLKLDRVSISDYSNQPLNYLFEYNYNPLDNIPSKTSFAQDYWGYFNGALNNTLIPRFPSINPQLTYGNRNVNTDMSKTFSLKSIVYPTGGKTQFTYEGNTAKPDGVASFFNPIMPNNMVQEGVEIILYGQDRLSYNVSPTETGQFGEKYFRKTFTIPSNGGFVNPGGGFGCNSSYLNSPDDDQLDCYNYNVDFNLEKINTDGSFTMIKTFRSKNCTTSSNPYINRDGEILTPLAPGSYRISVVLWFNPNTTSSNINHNYSIDFSVAWRNQILNPALEYVNVGGIRIKQIEDFDVDGSLAKKRIYSYTDPNTNQTSGQALSSPVFLRNMCNHRTGQLPPHDNTVDIQICGNPVNPLETTMGSYLGYQFVSEELVGLNGTANLKTVYNFSCNNPYFDPNYPGNNQTMFESQEWKRGKLLSTTYYKNNIPLKAEYYDYYEFSPNLSDQQQEDYAEEINTDYISNSELNFIGSVEDFYIPNPHGLNLVTWNYGVDNENIPNDVSSTLPAGIDLGMFYPYEIIIPYFKRFTGFNKPKQKTTITYDENAAYPITNTENYYYESSPSQYQTTKVQTVDSKRQVAEIDFLYPRDFMNFPPYNLMVARNIQNVVVQETKKINDEFISSTKTNFNEFTTSTGYNSIIAPKSIEETIGNSPSETQMRFWDYDNYGNALTVNGKNEDIPTSYVWGNNKQYKIAEVQGASFNDIAYTSFEDQFNYLYQESWNISTLGFITPDATAPTGKYCYSLTGNDELYKTGLNNETTYIVSYWSKDGSYQVYGSFAMITGKTMNGWTRYEHTVRWISQTSISGHGKIDEVRLYPKGSIMKTYSYIPLIGISTICDQNYNFAFYEYDNAGRLTLIRDQDKNILKKFCYNYNGQQSNCEGDATFFCNYNYEYTSYNIRLTNVANGTVYNFSVPVTVNQTLNLGHVPAGMYDILMSSTGGPGSGAVHYIYFGNYYSYTNPSTLTLSNVSISGVININLPF